MTKMLQGHDKNIFQIPTTLLGLILFKVQTIAIEKVKHVKKQYYKSSIRGETQ